MSYFFGFTHSLAQPALFIPKRLNLDVPTPAGTLRDNRQTTRAYSLEYTLALECPVHHQEVSEAWDNRQRGFVAHALL
jgi:hypothetical protein